VMSFSIGSCSLPSMRLRSWPSSSASATTRIAHTALWVTRPPRPLHVHLPTSHTSTVNPRRY
jgi:hypothetical protein